MLVLSHIVAIVYFSQLEKNDDPWRESIVIVFAVNIRGASKSSNVTLVSATSSGIRLRRQKQNLIRKYIAFYDVVTRSRKISETRDTIPRSVNRNASSSRYCF